MCEEIKADNKKHREEAGLNWEKNEKFAFSNAIVSEEDIADNCKELKAKGLCDDPVCIFLSNFNQIFVSVIEITRIFSVHTPEYVACLNKTKFMIMLNYA